MKKNKPSRASKNIRMWMLKVDLRPVSVAKALSITESAVSQFISGKLPSQRIREFFLLKGCPESLMQALDAYRENKRRAA